MGTTQNVVDLDKTTSEAAEKFTKLFYEAFDKRREVVHKMYMESASLVWNGNPLSGQQEIAAFITSLPSSKHTVNSLDAQPISDKLTSGQNSIVLMSIGSVRYQEQEHGFSESFILTADGEVWKIASQRFRFID